MDQVSFIFFKTHDRFHVRMTVRPLDADESVTPISKWVARDEYVAGYANAKKWYGQFGSIEERVACPAVVPF